MPFVDCSGRNMRFGPLLAPWNLLVVAERNPSLRWGHRNIPELRQIRTKVLRFAGVAAAVGADNLRIRFVVEAESDILRVAVGIHPAVAAGDSPGEDNWVVPDWQ